MFRARNGQAFRGGARAAVSGDAAPGMTLGLGWGETLITDQAAAEALVAEAPSRPEVPA